MTRIQTVYDAINRMAPFSVCMEGDCVGILVGSADAPVARAAVALDGTVDTVSRAKEAGCSLLVTHHPAYFGTLEEQPENSAAALARRLGVGIISAHTNLDTAKGGVNDVLAALLGLRNVETPDVGGSLLPMARVGDFQAENACALALYAGNKLGVGGVKYTPCSGAIARVAVCGGSGGDFLYAAKQAGAQALITGESKHHLRLLARELDVALIECGHFATEQPVKATLAALVEQCGAQAVVLEEQDPACYAPIQR